MQTAAIFADTWRLLKARKLFWIAVLTTVAICALYASLGFNDQGFSLFFFFDLKNETVRAGTPGAALMALNAFYLLTNHWTTLFGVILGLITCASIFPELMAGGVIDTALSKPIGRWKLFFLKFASGLMVSFILSALAAALVFFTLRWRVGFWHWPVFYSVPLAVVLYSYLYAICVLLGVWTRSTLAALLLTLLVWLMIFGLRTAEFISGKFLTDTSLSLALGQDETATATRTATSLHRAFRTMMLVLPKTNETTELIKRSVMRDEDKLRLREEEIEKEVEKYTQASEMFGRGAVPPEVLRQQVVQNLAARDAMEKSPAYILGTSLAFEVVVLLAAGWMFSRRDY